MKILSIVLIVIVLTIIILACCAQHDEPVYMMAIGTANPPYKPGDNVYISITGTDDFKNKVQTTIEKSAQPFINLNLNLHPTLQ